MLVRRRRHPPPSSFVSPFHPLAPADLLLPSANRAAAGGGSGDDGARARAMLGDLARRGGREGSMRGIRGDFASGRRMFITESVGTVFCFFFLSFTDGKQFKRTLN
jgi:hypothetical protein